MVIRPTVGLLLVAILTGAVAEATAAVDPIDVLDEALELTEVLDLDDPDRLSARLNIAALLAFAGHGDRGRALLDESQDVLVVPELRQQWADRLDDRSYLIQDCERWLVAAQLLCGDDLGMETSIARAAMENHSDELAAVASVVALRSGNPERGRTLARQAWEHYRQSLDADDFPSDVLARALAETEHFVELELLIARLGRDSQLFRPRFLSMFAHGLADAEEWEWCERVVTDLHAHLMEGDVHPIFVSLDYAAMGGVLLRLGDQGAAEAAFQEARGRLTHEHVDFEATLTARILAERTSAGGVITLTELRAASEHLVRTDESPISRDLIEAAVDSGHEDWALAQSRAVTDTAHRCRSLTDLATRLLLREHDTAIAADD